MTIRILLLFILIGHSAWASAESYTLRYKDVNECYINCTGASVQTECSAQHFFSYESFCKVSQAPALSAGKLCKNSNADYLIAGKKKYLPDCNNNGTADLQENGTEAAAYQAGSGSGSASGQASNNGAPSSDGAPGAVGGNPSGRDSSAAAVAAAANANAGVASAGNGSNGSGGSGSNSETRDRRAPASDAEDSENNQAPSGTAGSSGFGSSSNQASTNSVPHCSGMAGSERDACLEEYDKVKNAGYSERQRAKRASGPAGPGANGEGYNKDLSAEENSQMYLNGLDDNQVNGDALGNVKNYYANESCPDLKDSELAECINENQADIDSKAITQVCEGRDPQQMPSEEEGGIRATCASHNEGVATLRRARTASEVPGDFDQAKYNQGLMAFYDPDLPEDRYENTRLGTVRYPYENPACAKIIPPPGQQGGGNLSAGRYTASSMGAQAGPAGTADGVKDLAEAVEVGNDCPGKEGKNFFQTGEYGAEGLICERSRAVGCPTLNAAYGTCFGAFLDSYDSANFAGVKQSAFIDAFCSKEHLDSFKEFVLVNLEKWLQAVPDDNKPINMDSNLDRYSRQYLDFSSFALPPAGEFRRTIVKNSKKFWQKFIAAKRMELDEVNAGNEFDDITTAESQLKKLCRADCQYSVMNELTAEEFQKKLPGDFALQFGQTFPLGQFEAGGEDQELGNIQHPEAQGLRACTERAYQYRRNIFVSNCTALRAMARYGAEDDFTEAANDLETNSFDGRFHCARASMFTVDYESCKNLVNVYNAGFAVGMVGNQVMAVNDQIQAADIQKDAAEGAANGDQTAALDGMRRQMKHQRNNEIAKSSFHGINVAALGAAMSAYTTPSSIENDCASAMTTVHGWRCLQASHTIASNNPQYNAEFFANKNVLDQFYKVIIEQSGAGLVAGLKAYLYQKQADAIKDVKDSFVRPEFQDGRGYQLVEYCTRYPEHQICRADSNGRNRRTGVSFSGFEAGDKGGGVFDMSSNAMGEYNDNNQLTAAEKAAIKDLSNVMNNDNASSFGNDFKAPGAATAQVSGAGGGAAIAGAASAQGGGGGGATGASAKGGSSARRNIAGTSMTIGGKGGGFQRFGGSGFKKSKSNAKNALDNLLGKNKSSRTVANIQDERILPKSIGLFDKISERYVKVNGENRLLKVGSKKGRK